MDLRKLAFSDQFPYCASPRRKVVSGFGLGIVASFTVLSVLLFNLSFKAPILSPIFNGFNNFRVNNTSFASWPFSFSSTSSSYATTGKSGDLVQRVGERKVIDKTHEGNVSVISENGNILGEIHVGNFSGKVKNGSFVLEERRVKEKTQFVNGSDMGKNANNSNSEGESGVLGKTHLGNSSEKVKNGSSVIEEKRVKEKIQSVNGSDMGKHAKISHSEEESSRFLGKTHFGYSSENVKNGNFSGGDVRKSVVEENVAEKHVNESSVNNPVGFTGKSNNGKIKVAENHSRGNSSHNRDNLGCLGKEEWCSDVKNQRMSLKRNNVMVTSNNSQSMEGHNDSFGKCDLFDGRWVKDDVKPYYPAGSCPYIDRDFDCHLNGRPDDGFLKWKWQPYACDISSLNATDFLERLRGKKLVFVGDSLNRNMWESLVCVLRHHVRNKKRVYEISGRRDFKKKGLYAFRFEDYNCSVDFVGTPFLVRQSSFKGRNGSFETLRLDLMDQTTLMYRDADVVVFNTGHWWTHEKTSKGEDYYQEGNHVYPRLKVLEAYKRALTTWARWVDKNIDGSRTQVIFRGYSVTHFRGGQWNSGGQCHKETEPIFNETYLANYPSKMRALEHVLQQMKTPVIYLNISRLTDYRKDGHPSIYRKEYKTREDQIAAENSQDCSHWCLPGVPDTWNQLLYASLLQTGKGSWRR
ncbi:protein trichome birefringence-like 2 isoform X1 [Actinidia eriantha]|uniref:protein trichome birefringence-like 2 isoform X1 n=1 Tax=Actinidia eriantha TaxID=165200 RepID=UPI00258D3F51|nr:protein trichome birefringence-like 2 isoform X1 [Actinidia eriantha]